MAINTLNTPSGSTTTSDSYDPGPVQYSVNPNNDALLGMINDRLKRKAYLENQQQMQLDALKYAHPAQPVQSSGGGGPQLGQGDYNSAQIGRAHV